MLERKQHSQSLVAAVSVQGVCSRVLLRALKLKPPIGQLESTVTNNLITLFLS